MSEQTHARPSAATGRILSLGAIVGPVAFTFVWAILGFLSPGYMAWGAWIAPYSPVSQPISGLGLGVTAPFMNTAFVLCGLLTLAGVIGIFQSGITGLSLRHARVWRTLGAWLLLGSALTLALVVLFFLTFSPSVTGIQTGVAGLTERALTLEVHAWFVALGVLALRRLPRSATRMAGEG